MDVRFDGITVYHLYSSIINKYRESIFSFFFYRHFQMRIQIIQTCHPTPQIWDTIDSDPLPYETVDTNITATPVSESEAFYRHHLIHNR
jgi:hypothetical protein